MDEGRSAYDTNHKITTTLIKQKKKSEVYGGVCRVKVAGGRERAGLVVGSCFFDTSSCFFAHFFTTLGYSLSLRAR